MRHEWTDANRRFAAEHGVIRELQAAGDPDDCEDSAFCLGNALIVREILRLARRVKELEDAAALAGAGIVRAAAAERERIRRLALAGTEWLEPADFVPPRPSSREGDLWRRARAVGRWELAEELGK